MIAWDRDHLEQRKDGGCLRVSRRSVGPQSERLPVAWRPILRGEARLRERCSTALVAAALPLVASARYLTSGDVQHRAGLREARLEAGCRAAHYLQRHEYRSAYPPLRWLKTECAAAAGQPTSKHSALEGRHVANGSRRHTRARRDCLLAKHGAGLSLPRGDRRCASALRPPAAATVGGRESVPYAFGIGTVGRAPGRSQRSGTARLRPRWPKSAAVPPDRATGLELCRGVDQLAPP